MMSATLNGIETEREELDWILSSGVLGRSTNLTRMLTYICERHFEGRADEITEYRVAVEALGRRVDFDPHTDTIVRVTTHLLRKRLTEVYHGEGTSRPVRIVIPAGNYAPSFVPNESYVEQDAEQVAESETLPPLEVETKLKEVVAVAAATVGELRWRRRYGWIAIAAAVVVLLVVARLSVTRLLDAPQTPRTALLDPPNTVRALMGKGRKAFVDHSGKTWQPNTTCSGGTNVTVRPQKIVGALDPEIYLGGVRGITHCTFKVEPGLYEAHLYFAETTDLEPAQRKAIVTISAEPDVAIDVVDAAGGRGIALTRVFTGVRPQTDGAIHIDYTSEVSLLNAVEILPAPTGRQLPVRIVAGDAPFTDASNEVWQSDRYFVGGRRGLVWEAFKRSELGVYYADRIGRMRYVIPVVAGKKYRVRLYFRESWFGRADGGNSGVGRRVFDVSCNGAKMLKDFDISANGNKDGIVETFEDVEATPEGQIELYFSPVVNYPLVNAIEVLPEA